MRSGYISREKFPSMLLVREQREQAAGSRQIAASASSPPTAEAIVAGLR
jgi:hypothetical protein